MAPSREPQVTDSYLVRFPLFHIRTLERHEYGSFYTEASSHRTTKPTNEYASALARVFEGSQTLILLRLHVEQPVRVFL